MDEQPEWAKRMERKIDALLMAMQQMGFVQQIDGNMITALFGDRQVNRRHSMHWNHEQIQKVINQGLKGEAPKFDE